MKNKKKRVLTISDLHSGHLVGLTPPNYQVSVIGDNQKKYARVRKEVWGYFDGIVQKYKPFDVLIVNGDSLEGKGVRSGGTELITVDRNEQCKIAAAVIQYINAPVVRMTYGTASHTGTEEDFEDIIVETLKKQFDIKIGSHEWVDINGKIFDIKHKISGSTVPHGRTTALAREINWNRLWHVRGRVPKADVLIRSHVHYYEQIDHDECLGFILPCLQGYGSKYGSRECSGTIDIGAVIFDVSEKGELTWYPEFIKGQTQIAIAEKL